MTDIKMLPDKPPPPPLSELRYNKFYKCYVKIN